MGLGIIVMYKDCHEVIAYSDDVESLFAAQVTDCHDSLPFTCFVRDVVWGQGVEPLSWSIPEELWVEFGDVYGVYFCGVGVVGAVEHCE